MSPVEERAAREAPPRTGYQRVERAAGMAVLATACVLAGFTLVWQLFLIRAAGPLAFHESTILASTDCLLAGINPLSRDSLPQLFQPDGWLASLLAAPAAALWGNGFALHRLISAAALLGSAVLLFRMLRPVTPHTAVAASGAALAYFLLASTTLSLSGADALELLGSVWAIQIAYQGRFSPRSVATAACVECLIRLPALSVPLAVPLIAIHCLASRQWRAGATVVIAGVALWALPLGLAGLVAPGMLTPWLAAPPAAPVDIESIVERVREYGERTPGLWLALLVGALVLPFHKRRRSTPETASPADSPANRFDALLSTTIRVTAVAVPVWIALGHNPVPEMVGMITIILVVTAFRLASMAPPFRLLIALCLVGQAGVSLYSLPEPPIPNGPVLDQLEAWTRDQTVFASGPVVHYTEDPHELWDLGHAHLLRPESRDADSPLHKRWFQQEATLTAAVANRRFDIILNPQGGETLLSVIPLRKHYRLERLVFLNGYFPRRGEIALNRTVWPIEIWLPRTTGSGGLP